MKIISLIAVLFLVYCVSCIRGSSLENDEELDSTKSLHSSKIMDVQKLSVYYDLKTNETLKRISPPVHKQLPFNARPCSCDTYICSCCAGIRIHGFNFDREACAKMTYEPKASVIDFDLTMNNVSIYKRTLSSENRQFCVPILPITFMGPVDMCVRLMDIAVTGQQMHVCLNMLTRVSQHPIMMLQFNCVEMGPGGVGLSLPGLIDPANSSLSGTTNSSELSQSDSDVFDAVTDIPSTTILSQQV